MAHVDTSEKLRIKTVFAGVGSFVLLVTFLYTNLLPLSEAPPSASAQAQYYTHRGTITGFRAASAPTSSTFSMTAANPGSSDTLLIGIASAGGTISSVTYGGVAATELRTGSATGIRMGMWVLRNPAAGSNTLTITFGSAVGAVAVGATFYSYPSPPPYSSSAGVNGTQQCMNSSGTYAFGRPEPSLAFEVFAAAGNKTPFSHSGTVGPERYDFRSGTAANDVSLSGTEIFTGNIQSCAASSGNIAVGARTITFPAPPPTVDLKVNGSDGPISVPSGSTVSLSWTTTNSPDFCLANNAWNGSKAEGGGSESLGPINSARTYELECQNTSGSMIDSVVVNIGASDVDCGLRIRENAATVRIACQPVGTLTSPLRIRKNNTTYGVILVPTTDALASKTRIQTSAGIRALKRLP